jgi:integrase/recombinase XerD
MNEIRRYLKESTRGGTIDRYMREIEAFIQSSENSINADYQEVSDYFLLLGERSKNLSVHRSALKKYFDFLVEKELRTDNPIGSLNLKLDNNKKPKIEHVFSPDELSLLLNRKERYGALKWRNKLILSLLTYQGLTNGEITRLTLNDMIGKKLSIKESFRLNGRVLELKEVQLDYLYAYLKERKQLIKEETEILFITKKGTIEKGEGIGYLLETARYLFEGKKINPITVRQSVIVNKFKEGWDVRQVQLFCGIKNASYVENYKLIDNQEVFDATDEFHPLD